MVQIDKYDNDGFLTDQEVLTIPGFSPLRSKLEVNNVKQVGFLLVASQTANNVREYFITEFDLATLQINTEITYINNHQLSSVPYYIFHVEQKD